MKLKNKAMLITYADSLGKNLKELKYILDTYFKDAIDGVHILPFFPSSADRGFAPMTYREVDKAFGNWEDINAIAKDYYLMYDYMINHISASSEYFKDFKENKDSSEYKDLFIRYNKFWDNEEEQKSDLDKVYKRKPRDPFIEVEFKDGSKEKLWCTFDEEQVDLNIKSDTTKKFTKENLTFLANNGASIIRLDAFAYATKKKGTNCFFIEPDVYEILDECKEILEKNNVEILPEIHEHYTIQLKLSEKGYWVYDFVLPMLLLYTLYSGKNERLIHWLKICPRKQFTTLDTHDGIGVVDVKDILTDEEIEFTKEYLFDNGANIKRIYNTMTYNNLDIYQINCTYYSALGNNDKSYLLSRVIQIFTPGIPQIYYVGLLAGKTDIELLEETKVGRNINRHYYTLDEIEKENEREVVKQLLNLLKFRNSYDAFNGDIFINENVESNIIDIKWEKDDCFANLKANLETYDFSIYYYDLEDKKVKGLSL